MRFDEGKVKTREGVGETLSRAEVRPAGWNLHLLQKGSGETASVDPFT